MLLAPKPPTLSQVLRLCGYTTKPAAERKRFPAKTIYKNSEPVFQGTATEVWKWLRGRKQVDEKGYVGIVK